MKKLFLLLIVIIIIAVPLINSKNSVSPKDLNFNNNEDIEKKLSLLLKSEDLNLEKRSELIKSLPDIKWDNYKEDQAESIKKDIAKLIQGVEIKGKEEIDSLIKVADKFSRDDYEKIIEKLAVKYEEDMEEFIKALSENEDKLMDIGYYFNDLNLYGETGRNMGQDYVDITSSDKLNDQEKLVGYKFLEIISSCDT